MPSMVLLMSAMRALLAEMASMLRTTPLTTSPPCVATSIVALASTSAWRAESALLRTVVFYRCIDAAVLCTLLACCSVR